MASELIWNGAEFEKALRKATTTGLKRAGTFYRQKAVEAVSKPNTGVSVPVKTPDRKDGARDRRYKPRTKTIYPNPSLPGEPPKVRTGHGRRHIVMNIDPDGEYVRIGITSNAMYMLYLELGTRWIARRPWLLRSLFENSTMISRLLVIDA